MNSNKKFLQKVEIEPGIFEITYQSIHSGACQCFKDCNCAEQKGQVLRTFKMYSNDLVLQPNGKPREYTTIEGCKSSLQAFTVGL